MNKVQNNASENFNELLEKADSLCSAVIAGAPGQMKLALQVAHVLSDLRRSGQYTKKHR